MSATVKETKIIVIENMIESATMIVLRDHAENRRHSVTMIEREEIGRKRGSGCIDDEVIQGEVLMNYRMETRLSLLRPLLLLLQHEGDERIVTGRVSIVREFLRFVEFSHSVVLSSRHHSKDRRYLAMCSYIPAYSLDEQGICAFYHVIGS